MIGAIILTILFSICGLFIFIGILTRFVESILEKDLEDFLLSSIAIIFVIGVALVLLGI